MRQVTFLSLRNAIYKSWDQETSYDPKNWSDRNSAWGQCTATALIVQDFFGGSLKRISLVDNPNPLISGAKCHYFNVVGGRVMDLTGNQFGPNGHDYVMRHAPRKPKSVGRKSLLTIGSVRGRYKILRRRVLRNLNHR